MIDPSIYFLVMMFGSSTWLTINSVWVELSLYTNRLPEGWSLPSYLATVIQVACLLTLAYSIVHRYTRFSAIKAPLILSLLIFGSVCMFLLAFLWEKTVWILEREYSLALITLTFSLALVCAASNVFFLPYMSTFHPTYMTAYFVGMSFSSLVPSALKIVQGVGNYICVERPSQNGTSKFTAVQTELLFQVKIYNFLIFLWMCAATICFALLHWKFGRPAENRSEDVSIDVAIKSSTKNESHNSVQGQFEAKQQISAEEVEENEQSPLKPNKGQDGEKRPTPHGPMRYWTLISVLALICAEMNTIVPSIQSYATLAYSMLTYHLALTLSNISHPIANFLPIFFKPRSLPFILALASICTVLTAFIFILALQSPNPLLRESFPLFGSFLSIGASIMVGFLCSYLRTHLTGLIRSEHKEDGESALFWCGFFMQIGSFLGACAMFPLVNFSNMFQKRDPCSP